MHVLKDPLIHKGCANQGLKTQLARSHSHNNPEQFQEESEQKVDLLIQDIWQKGTDSVHDM